MTVKRHLAGGRFVAAIVLLCGAMCVPAAAQYANSGDQRLVGRHLLTGTYQLQADRGDDPRNAADRAARSVPLANRQRTADNLLMRLEAPEILEIERIGNSVTVASTRGARITLQADGNNRAEHWTLDRTMNTRATLKGERLVVASSGDRGHAFSVTFEPMNNGNVLRMTRTIDDDRLRRPVTVRSFYRRVSAQPRWETARANSPVRYDGGSYPAGEFVVPDGMRLVATLENALNTTRLRQGDPCTMTVHSPSQFDGAVIQGFVSTVNGSRRPTGGADLTLELQSIQLHDGHSYPFEGYVEDVRTFNGDTIRVDRGDSRTQKTIERSVIGAAIGAIVGAVAGGGKGAAIGAVIGAGGGAGTVIIEGRDHLDLARGTELTIVANGRGDRR